MALDENGMKDKILNALNELGDTPEQVFDELYRKGIRGDGGNCRTCPIANYLSLVMGFPIQVDGGRVIVPMSGLEENALIVSLGGVCAPCFRVLELPLPMPIQQFITGFDRDLYLELLA